MLALGHPWSRAWLWDTTGWRAVGIAGNSRVGARGARIMSEMRHPRRVLRRFGAVLSGLLAVLILSIATDMALRAAGVFQLEPLRDSLNAT